MERQDRRLVDRARSGEPQAFRELVERYKQKIYFLALDLTGNHHDAEDLSQEVFIKMYRSLHTFRGEARLSSWLYRITVNTWINQQRRKSQRAVSLQEDFTETPNEQGALSGGSLTANPEQSTEARMIQRHVDQALSRLPAKQRSVFVLRHYHDLPLKEIAEVLKVSEGTVKSLLFRALRRLQSELAFYRRDLGLEESA